MDKLTNNQASEQANTAMAVANSKVRDDNLCRSVKSRAGWAEAFAIMAQNHDDVLLDQVIGTEWDQSNWEW